MYDDKKLYIHFHDMTDEKSIKSKYPKANIVSLNGKLWVINPYMNKYPGIQYKPEYKGNSFQLLAYNYSAKGSIDMSPVYVKELDKNLFYKKVEDDHYYMIGDNRDNSNDSRFWGSVSYSLIVGKPWLIYMSLEFRSYDWVMNGNGGGEDHDKLHRICPNMDISSKACEALWNKQRYTVRWSRVGRRIESLQLNQPVE